MNLFTHTGHSYQGFDPLLRPQRVSNHDIRQRQNFGHTGPKANDAPSLSFGPQIYRLLVNLPTGIVAPYPSVDILGAVDTDRIEESWGRRGSADGFPDFELWKIVWAIASLQIGPNQSRVVALNCVRGGGTDEA